MLRNHLVWDDHRHSVGIDSVDVQHRRMIELINRINDTLGNGEQVESAWNAMDELLVFTAEHFAHEEEVMLQQGYPDVNLHIEEHRKMLAQMRNLVGEARHSLSPVKVGLLPAFLADWAELHILHDDRKLGAFLAAREKDA
jgi:hemerythrin-like metal-binding protein